MNSYKGVLFESGIKILDTSPNHDNNPTQLIERLITSHFTISSICYRSVVRRQHTSVYTRWTATDRCRSETPLKIWVTKGLHSIVKVLTTSAQPPPSYIINWTTFYRVSEGSHYFRRCNFARRFIWGCGFFISTVTKEKGSRIRSSRFSARPSNVSHIPEKLLGWLWVICTCQKTASFGASRRGEKKGLTLEQEHHTWWGWQKPTLSRASYCFCR